MELNDSRSSAVLNQNGTDHSLCDHMPLEISDAAVKASLILISVLSVLGNSTVCIIVSRHYQLHTVTNAFFVNMAVIQLLFALLSIPPFLRLTASASSLLTGQRLCVLIGFTFELFATLSNLALTLMAIERYYVINNSGRKKISAKTTGKLIFFACLLALIFAILWTALEGSSIQCSASSHIVSGLSCLPLLSDGRNGALRIINIICVVMCFLIPMALKGGLFLKLSKSLWSGSHGVRPMGVGNLKTIRFCAEIKTTRTLLFISVLHLCCWLPICAISLYLSSLRQQQTANRLQLDQAKVVSICLAFASSCINPLIYAFRNPRFSMVFRQSKQRARKKRVNFYQTDLEKHDGETAKVISWAQKSQAAFVYDTSKSEETITTSSI